MYLCPCHRVGHQNGVPGSWFWPGQALPVGGIWGVRQQMGDLCSSLPFFKKTQRLKLGPGGLNLSEINFHLLLFICKIFNFFLYVYYNEYFRIINFPLSSNLVVFCRFYFVASLSFSSNLKLWILFSIVERFKVLISDLGGWVLFLASFYCRRVLFVQL